MGNNSQSRKWALVINNPLEAGLDHSTIKEILQRFSPAYYCMGDEIASTGTYHTHLFFYAPSPVRFSTVKNRFPTAHIEKAYGTVQDNRAYIRKDGQWADTDKAETSVPGTFEEWGEIPPERAEKHPEMFRLVQNIRDGMTTTEIIDDNPAMAFRVRDIDLLRQTLTAEKYAVENRPLQVSYLYGASGAGKTRSIYETHDPRSIYRVTNYRAARGVSFDGYHGQEVLVFEEFSSQIPIEDMLNYLDIYPLALPARYNDKTACYTMVYITSNLPVEKQYRSEQWDRPETWRAFLRRIHTVIEYLPDGSTVIHKKGGFPYDREMKKIPSTGGRKTDHLFQRMKRGLESVRDTPHKRVLLAAYLIGAVLVWLFRGVSVRPRHLRHVFPRPGGRYQPPAPPLRRGRPPGRPGASGDTLGRQSGKGGLAESGACQSCGGGPSPHSQAAGHGQSPADGLGVRPLRHTPGRMGGQAGQN